MSCHRLALRETGDPGTARRAAWFAALFPAAAVLVLGYAEATAMMLGVVVFLGLRSRRFGWAIGAGFLAGLCRPVGVLLVKTTTPLPAEATLKSASVPVKAPVPVTTVPVANAVAMSAALAPWLEAVMLPCLSL